MPSSYRYRPVIILAKSYKLGQRCIAGIFYDTGEWVRPVTAWNGGSIDEKLIKDINILDIVEIPFSTEKGGLFKYQRENWSVGPLLWKRCGVLKREELLRYCENNGLILHTDYEYVEPEYLETLPPSEWKSLQLIKTKARFVERILIGKPRKRVQFMDGKGNELDLPITDEAFLERFYRFKNTERDCLIAVSLGLPWQPKTGTLPLRCYKLAAGIILL